MAEADNQSAQNAIGQWKAILAAIGGILVVVLQIINVLLSNDIEHVVGLNKAQSIDNGQKLLQNRTQLLQNSDQLQANSEKLLRALSDSDQSLHNGYENGVKKVLEAIQASSKPSPTPR